MPDKNTCNLTCLAGGDDRGRIVENSTSADSLSAISQNRRWLFRKIQGNCARPSEIEGIGVVLDDDGQRFEHFAQMVPHGRLRGVGRSVGDSLNQYAVL